MMVALSKTEAEESKSPILNYLAIDPGDVHQGTAYFEVDFAYNAETQQGDPSLICHWTRDLKRTSLLKLVEDAHIDALIVEAYVLYPWMAREQGYSDFPTVKVIGVLQYICELRGIPCFIQGADVKKKARRIGERGQFPGAIRMLGTGRNRYRGWDFHGPSQHERDAIAHGVWWSFNHPVSKLRNTHINNQCKFIQGVA
jgi:hypothetical protein